MVARSVLIDYVKTVWINWVPHISEYSGITFINPKLVKGRLQLANSQDGQELTRKNVSFDSVLNVVLLRFKL